jgi:nicotinic acid phosphoribosyltransferase
MVGEGDHPRLCGQEQQDVRKPWKTALIAPPSTAGPASPRAQCGRRLDEAGYPAVRIVASSGFGADKCRVMADAHAPIDVVGTGSFIPDLWTGTYATADIVDYDGVPMVKVGREFLLRKNGERKKYVG